MNTSNSTATTAATAAPVAPAKTPLQTLADEATAVQTAIQTASTRASAHLANVRAAKLPFNIGFATAANGALVEAGSKLGVHLQSLNKQVGDEAAKAKDEADVRAAKIAADEAVAAAAAKTAVDSALENVGGGAPKA